MPKSMYILAFATLALPSSLAQSPKPGTTADDLLHRDPAIHWPAAFDPSTAKIFSHNELLIHADCRRVFTRLIDLPSWPTWFVLTRDVEILGPDKTVKEGTTAHLLIFGTAITTRIAEFVPDSRLSWVPRATTKPIPATTTPGDSSPSPPAVWSKQKNPASPPPTPNPPPKETR